MVKQARIGRFDGELKSVLFNDGDSVQSLFDKIGLTVGEAETVKDENDNTVSMNQNATDEATYYITGNFKQGC